MSEENEKLFYHERQPQKEMWNGSWRGVPFEIVRWEWSRKVTAIASSLREPAWNCYLYLNVELIPPKYGPSTFWIKPEPFLMPLMPEEKTGHGIWDDTMGAAAPGLNKLTKRMNRRNLRNGRTIYRYSDHPILSNIEFHGGATFYEREFAGNHRIVKIGCDWSHACDHTFEGIENPMNYHPLPVTLDMVIDNAKEAIDSFYKMVPEYGREAEKDDE